MAFIPSLSPLVTTFLLLDTPDLESHPASVLEPEASAAAAAEQFHPITAALKSLHLFTLTHSLRWPHNKKQQQRTCLFTSCTRSNHSTNQPTSSSELL